MTAFEYTITDSIGIHARPAGMLAKKAAKFKSKVFLHFGDIHFASLPMMLSTAALISEAALR